MPFKNSEQRILSPGYSGSYYLLRTNGWHTRLAHYPGPTYVGQLCFRTDVRLNHGSYPPSPSPFTRTILPTCFTSLTDSILGAANGTLKIVGHGNFSPISATFLSSLVFFLFGSEIALGSRARFFRRLSDSRILPFATSNIVRWREPRGAS